MDTLFKVDTMAHKRNIKLRILLLAIITIGIGLLGIAAYAISCYPKQTFIVFIAAVLYMSIVAAINPKRKWAKWIYNILAFPVTILLTLIMFLGPSLALATAVLFAWVTAVLPIVLVLWLYYVISGCEVSHPFNLFAILSFSAILLSQSTRLIKYIMLKIGIYRIWRTEPTKRGLLDIGLYSLQPENIHFIYSIGYVVFLIISAYFNLYKGTNVFSPEYDKAILSAFLVYVAYKTMMGHFNRTEMNAEGLMAKIFKLYHVDKWLKIKE